MIFRNEAGAGVAVRATWRIVVVAVAVLAFWLVMSAAGGVAAADTSDQTAQTLPDIAPVVVTIPDGWRSG